MPWVSQQEVATFECFPIFSQCTSVGRVPLSAEKIQIIAALFRSACHQSYIPVAEPDYRWSIGQIITVIFSRSTVDLHAELAVLPGDTPCSFFRSERESEIALPMHGELVEFVCAWRVEGQGKAYRLQQAGFSLGISTK